MRGMSHVCGVCMKRKHERFVLRCMIRYVYEVCVRGMYQDSRVCMKGMYEGYV